jgi:D-tyrosyl-tRNA(Tyr) deacylase
MKAVIQRVQYASVKVEGEIVGNIERGLLILLGITHSDTTKDIEYLTSKIVQMRIFNDENGKMNRSVQDMGGQILLISQFTLFAETRKGNRPSFAEAAPSSLARELYDQFAELLSVKLGSPISKGVFGADMKVSLLNDGPVTILIDSLEYN